jgi:alkylhydroperoxidase/carboxymuconolactone decarboxylase family protein YurZ
LEGLKKLLEKEKENYGEHMFEESGLSYMFEVCPERVELFLKESKADFSSSLSKKTLELVLFGASVALRSEIGFKAHAIGALKAGATKREVLDVLFAVGNVASHALTMNILKQIKTLLEGTSN